MSRSADLICPEGGPTVDGFSDIPDVVIDYVRAIFAAANDKVSQTVAAHPSMHEETLDHILIMELTATPPAFFASERMGFSIESHWLGGRWMFSRWEIADVAFFVLLRRLGRLVARKVALLQTKRLYSKDIDVSELDEADYRIGIGHLADRTDPQVPLSHQRAFTFDNSSVYGAARAGHPQVERIAEYISARGIPVHCGLYNPVSLPYAALYPPIDGIVPSEPNSIGCRVVSAAAFHGVLRKLQEGQAPAVENLVSSLLDPADKSSIYGWRLERFIADEMLQCRQGVIFDDVRDPNLGALLYGRSAPISAAITITVDFGPDK